MAEPSRADMPASGSRTEHVGRFQMTVVRAEPTQESEERWTRRADALAQWLLEQWRQEQVARERRPEGKEAMNGPEHTS
jgi:hypothetical protein